MTVQEYNESIDATLKRFVEQGMSAEIVERARACSLQVFSLVADAEEACQGAGMVALGIIHGTVSSYLTLAS